MKKYLLVINCCEEETYLYDTLEDLLNDNEVSSLKELFELNNWLHEFIVYEVSNIYKGE